MLGGRMRYKELLLLWKPEATSSHAQFGPARNAWSTGRDQYVSLIILVCGVTILGLLERYAMQELSNTTY